MNNLYLSGLVSLLFLTLANCVEPVEPEYRFREGFLLVDGRLSNLEGNSYVDLKRSLLVGRQYVLQSIVAQNVTLVSGSGESVEWSYDQATARYYLPDGYTPLTGEVYHVSITDEEGTVFESDPESMPEAVQLDRLDVRFAQESYFSDELGRFVPAFELFVDFEEPGSTSDHYRLNYSSWEYLNVCLSCVFGFFDIRVGECVAGGRGAGVPRFDYPCSTDCWQLKRYPDINLFADEFSNGNNIRQLAAGRVDYDFPGRILIISELERISAEAYEYTRVLSSQGVESNSLNATLPASLDGNLRPVNENEGSVLGYFSVGASSEMRLSFNRDTVSGTPLPFDNFINFDEPPFPEFPYEHPCEGPNRSRLKPEGWDL